MGERRTKESISSAAVGARSVAILHPSAHSHGGKEGRFNRYLKSEDLRIQPGHGRLSRYLPAGGRRAAHRPAAARAPRTTAYRRPWVGRVG